MRECTQAGNPDDIALGRALIASGKVGCIVLAGGDGSRLGWEGPKGTFPISLVKQKTLFQLLCERVMAASAYFNVDLPLAVMASPLNIEETHAAFSVHKGPVDIFEQMTIPLLDKNQKPLPDKRPNGNGEVLKQFYQAGLYQKWKELGIEHVQIVLIDNPLAEPFDPNLIGAHFKARADVSLKAVEKQSPEERVGVIGKTEEKIRIIEYSESPPTDWKLANTSLFCFTMDFVEQTKNSTLPLHKVKKFVDTKPVFKQECFIFDLLEHAQKVEVILYPREETFAPLKSRDDLGAVQRALLERDKQAFHKLTGQKPGDAIFELHPALHFPTDTLKKKWHGKPLGSSRYLENE